MRGPGILARTLSIATKRGKDRRAWQYHSRSDTHSKVACWSVLFDLLTECDIFREHARQGLVGFAINHEMIGPINKTLDLVVTVVPPDRRQHRRRVFADLIETYGIPLAAEERTLLASLPVIEEETAGVDISEVSIALEAKACMTEHLKSMPRLHAEILATGYLARRAAPRCISVSYSLVNSATTFVTPSKPGETNKHTQPEDARRVVKMLGTAIPLARDVQGLGYDVVGVSVVDCRNDGSPVTVVQGDPAPSSNDHFHYGRMIRSLCSEYRSRFGR